jgi:hypothetical protein
MVHLALPLSARRPAGRPAVDDGRPARGRAAVPLRLSPPEISTGPCQPAVDQHLTENPMTTLDLAHTIAEHLGTG